MYVALSSNYNWTFEDIANMTPHQQIVAYAFIHNDDNPLNETKEFSTHEEYLQWKANRT